MSLPASSGSGLWVFAYGSLIWKPGFPFLSAERARLIGFHRALCIFSVRYRGSSQKPGLVFGLDAGGFCEGVVFRVAAEHVAATASYLRDREQVTGAYRAEMRLVERQNADGVEAQRGGPGAEKIRALAFIANRTHRQYAGTLPLATQIRIVRASAGVSGPNSDYVRNTAQHLAALGIRDRSVQHLAALVGAASQLGNYPHGTIRALPPDRALRSGYQRNVGL